VRVWEVVVGEEGVTPGLFDVKNEI